MAVPLSVEEVQRFLSLIAEEWLQRELDGAMCIITAHSREVLNSTNQAVLSRVVACSRKAPYDEILRLNTATAEDVYVQNVCFYIVACLALSTDSHA